MERRCLLNNQMKYAKQKEIYITYNRGFYMETEPLAELSQVAQVVVKQEIAMMMGLLMR